MTKFLNKYALRLLLLALFPVLTFSCFDDNDDELATGDVIKSFIYRGMNELYLYKADVPELADGFYASDDELQAAFNQFDTPEEYFNSLLFQPGQVDRFSFLVDNYIALEQAFQGVSTTNGVEFGLVRYPNAPTQVFGYIRYILPGTDAEAQGLMRGMIFNTVDGVQLDENNFSSLLAPDTYTLGFADFDGTNVTPNGQSTTLTKQPYTENPILIADVINQGANRIGYLMYNSFVSNFDGALNDVFADFQAANITHLVLDLRYNGGGSVSSAVQLSSSVYGTNTTEIFSTLEFNEEYQMFFEENDPDRLVNTFVGVTTDGDLLTRLNLDKVFVLTSGRTASASELVINGLTPYIDVVQIGTASTGKFQGSFTLYDSANFGREGANPSHTYALQPLVFRTLNANGNTDFPGGLIPDIELAEDFTNLGQLGDVNEPLLAAALDNIMNGGVPPSGRRMELETISGSTEMKPTYGIMVDEDVILREDR